MRHQIKGRKLNVTSSHRKAMLANMAVSLVTHEQIKTTLPKAKELRPYIEVLVTKAKNNNLSARRNILSQIRDKKAIAKLINVLGARYKDRPGGYTRIVKAGFRYGDLAPIAYIEFVDRDINPKGHIPQDNSKEDIKSNKGTK